MMRKFIWLDSDEAGAVIGKNGGKIMEIRELSGARLVVDRQGNFNAGGKNRLMRIEGSEREVAFASHLVDIRLRLHRSSLENGLRRDDEGSSAQGREIQTAATALAMNSDI